MTHRSETREYLLCQLLGLGLMVWFAFWGLGGGYVAYWLYPLSGLVVGLGAFIGILLGFYLSLFIGMIIEERGS